MEQLIIATGNKKKFREIKKILGRVSLRVRCLADFAKRPRIVEDGLTFFENARKKAEAASLFYNSWALGEDSGLEVAVLGGRPGIFSSRFAGRQATDAKNIRKLLRELKGVPSSRRKARFLCCAVLARRGKAIKRFQGILSGYISARPKGSSGFGYDPVFYVPGLKKTLAEVPPRVKNKLSHRYKAISRFRSHLRNYLKKHKHL